MTMLLHLSALALKNVVRGACTTLGVAEGAMDGDDDALGPVAESLVEFLTARFADHSLRLTNALKESSDRAWRALPAERGGHQ
jgi:hypothetical protein